MNILEKRTLKLLKKIKRLNKFDIKVSDLYDINILNSEGYIQVFGTLTAENLVKSPNWMNYLAITPQGKLYLSTYRHQRITFLIPIVISTTLSLIAIIISLIALIKP